MHRENLAMKIKLQQQRYFIKYLRNEFNDIQKKNWDAFTGGLYFKKFCNQDVHHNNSNNSVATFMKLSDKNPIFY